jgi:hypothetical protein
MTDITTSNSLAHLAARIRDAHRDVGMLLTRSVERAFDAGELLIEAKAQLKHGQWLPWLRDHVEISERAAQLYMRLARYRPTIEANPQPVAELSFKGALALLTKPSTAVKLVAAAAAEVIQDKAEAARREVMFDAIERNGEAVAALTKKWVPDDFEPGPEPEWLQKFFADLLETITNNGDEYALAVECGDHDHAFDLVSWAHDLSVDMRSMCEDIAKSAGSEPAS